MSRKNEIRKLIVEHNRHLQILKEKKASFGLHTPSFIITEIEDREAEIERLQVELEEIESGRVDQSSLDSTTSPKIYAPQEKSKTTYNKKLIVLSLIGHVNEIRCIFDSKASLGRSPECDFSFAQAPLKVSNWHARIRYVSKTNEYYIEDLGSTNGTYVDGRLIERATHLNLGSKVQLGNSLSFIFEYHNNDPLATGSLIFHTPDGKELARYIIVPKEKVLIGNAMNEAVKLPFLQPGSSLGCIIRRSNGFYLVDENTSSDLKLEENMKLEFASLSIMLSILK